MSRIRGHLKACVFGAMGLLAASSVSAAELTLGDAANFAILAVHNSTYGSSLTINSANTVIGNVGVGADVTVLDIKKIGEVNGVNDVWNGALLSHSATINLSDKDTNPDGGFYAPSALLDDKGKLHDLLSPGYMGANFGGIDVQTYLDNAVADAWALNTFLGGQSYNDVNVINGTTLVGAGGVNYLSILDTINFNSNTLTLSGTADDLFVLRYDHTDFDWSQSQLILDGISSSQVLWWFSGQTEIEINKATTVFGGTILALNLNKDLIYHNPATFNGAIIANRINLHSDFNLTHTSWTPPDTPPPPPTVVPEPGTLALLGLGLLGFGVVRFRRSR